MRGQERETVSKIQSLNAKIAFSAELEKERGTLHSQIRNLIGQINSIEKHLGPLKEWLEWKSAKSKLTSADANFSEVLATIENRFPEGGYAFEGHESGSDDVKAVNSEIEEIFGHANQFAAEVLKRIEAAKVEQTKLQADETRRRWLKKCDEMDATQLDFVHYEGKQSAYSSRLNKRD